MQELKTIDLEAKQFEANGIKYFIESTLSIERYRKFEEIEVELGFGRSFAEVFDHVRNAMDDINAQKQGDAYVKLYNIINGVQQIGFKKPHVFRYCALFINAEGEDRKTITDDMMNKKIDDWQKEGLDFQPFFSFAISSLPGFKERYRKLIQATSTGDLVS